MIVKGRGCFGGFLPKHPFFYYFLTNILVKSHKTCYTDEVTSHMREERENGFRYVVNIKPRPFPCSI